MHGVLAVANFRSTFTPETVYYHLDPLGSVRAVTSAAGAVLERHDYRPFGEDNMPLPAPGADPSRFLGQQRDQTKLDQFGARYYSMFTGRFTGVDPVINAGAVASPQRWNRYAYALNNPLRYTDTTGLDADGGDLDAPIPPCMECHEADAWMAERDALWWETWHEWRAEELERQRSAAGPTQQQIIAQLPAGTADATRTAVAESNAPILVPLFGGGVLMLPGGFRETGVLFWSSPDGSNPVPLPTVPGPWTSPDQVREYNYSMLPDINRIPAGADRNFGRPFGSLHVHPAGVGNRNEFDGPPSRWDKEHMIGNFGIVVSAAEQRVYFYVAGRDRGSMSLAQFLRTVK